MDSQENQVLLPVDVLEALKEQEQYLDTLLVRKTIQQVYYEKTGDLWIPNSIRIVVQYPERTRIFDTIWIWQ
ncbi:MAG: hypothetical protein KBT48_12050 [Firmicutes bacterium]|nr:hypothetical protein [Bacillota bacterium]